jgi:hypothetical protein
MGVNYQHPAECMKFWKFPEAVSAPLLDESCSGKAWGARSVSSSSDSVDKSVLAPGASPESFCSCCEAPSWGTCPVTCLWWQRRISDQEDHFFSLQKEHELSHSDRVIKGAVLGTQSTAPGAICSSPVLWAQGKAGGWATLLSRKAAEWEPVPKSPVAQSTLLVGSLGLSHLWLAHSLGDWGWGSRVACSPGPEYLRPWLVPCAHSMTAVAPAGKVLSNLSLCLFVVSKWPAVNLQHLLCEQEKHVSIMYKACGMKAGWSPVIFPLLTLAPLPLLWQHLWASLCLSSTPSLVRVGGITVIMSWTLAAALHLWRDAVVCRPEARMECKHAPCWFCDFRWLCSPLPSHPSAYWEGHGLPWFRMFQVIISGTYNILFCHSANIGHPCYC